MSSSLFKRRITDYRKTLFHNSYVPLYSFVGGVFLSAAVNLFTEMVMSGENLAPWEMGATLVAIPFWGYAALQCMRLAWRIDRLWEKVDHEIGGLEELKRKGGEPLEARERQNIYEKKLLESTESHGRSEREEMGLLLSRIWVSMLVGSLVLCLIPLFSIISTPVPTVTPSATP